jgi:hypothetical protein
MYITTKIKITLMYIKFGFVHQVSFLRSLSKAFHTNIPHHYIFCTLNGTSILQELSKITLLGLEIRVATNVLLLDVDVGNGGLTVDFLQRSLDIGTIIYCRVLVLASIV